MIFILKTILIVLILTVCKLNLILFNILIKIFKTLLMLTTKINA